LSVQSTESTVLDRNSFKGDASDYELSADGKNFTKKRGTHCGISSKAPLPIGSSVQIRYLAATGPQGWLAVGIHRSPSSATSNSIIDANFYGVNASNDVSNGTYISGAHTNIGNLNAQAGSTITLVLNTTSVIISCDTPRNWSHTITLPADNGSPWYLHFNSFSASFQILN
jgi:hypothetical protein